MSSLSGRITMLASSDAPVLVSGAKGVGKELVARAIHALGPRREGPLVVIEAAALPEMMEASVQQELSLPRCRDAWFRAASEGTLIIDGIDRLPLRAQGELLRVIDDPVARARRGPSWEPRGVRILSLSRGGLTEKVASGEFLDSLYYRVNAIHIHVPALDERELDLLPLAAELLRELTPPNISPPGISADAWSALSRHTFEGNVRELRWVLEGALVRSDGKEIAVSHLPPHIVAERT